jgi:hypothetical protein
MTASITADQPNSPELVLGIFPSTRATGLALRNPASRPQLTWGALLAPEDGEDLADYADRITGLVATIRSHRDQPVTVHLAGRRTGYVQTHRGEPHPPDGDLHALTRAIELGLAQPLAVVPYGDYADALSDWRPAPLRGGWPDGWYPHQHHDSTAVIYAATLTRWVPYSPAPSTSFARDRYALRVAPLRGHEARSDPKGARPGELAAAAPSWSAASATASVADGRR